MNIVEQLSALATAMGCRFTLKGEPIAYNKVFSPTGLLPAFLRRADQLCSFCLGYGLGLTFERAEGALLGVSVALDDTASQAVRLLCLADVLHEITQYAPSKEAVSLDELMLD